MSADGHRCEYTQREGKGPRGGRRTWTIARCIACGATAQQMDSRPGMDSSVFTREILCANVPRCPVPIEPALPERMLRGLNAALKGGDRSAPPLGWAIEFMPAGGGDPDDAIQRSWRGCEDVEVMREALSACGVGGRFLRGHSGDEVGETEFIALELDGVMVDLSGPAAAVARALRLHVPP